MDMREYIEKATEQIRARRARDMVARELEAHMEDQAAYCREQGMSEEEAEREAVRQMGDPIEVGISMDRIHRPQTDWKMLLMLVFLCGLGLCLQIAFNRELVEAHIMEVGGAVSSGLFSGMSRGLLVTLTVAVVLGILVCTMDYTVVFKYIPWFICLMLFILWMESVVIWHNLSPMGVFPVSWYYLLIPLYGSLLFRYRGSGKRGFIAGIFLIFCIAGICMFLGGFMSKTRTMTLVRFVGVLAVMLSVAVVCGWYGDHKGSKLLLLWGGGIVTACMAVMSMLLRGGFRAQRIRAILHPFDYADSSGYYVVMVRGWLGRCNLLGNPEAAKQFLENYMGADYVEGVCFSPGDANILYLFLRYGILPGVTVCLIFLVCIGYFMYKCLRQKNQLGRVVGTGCCIAFLMEFIGYLMSNLGLLPGYANLPFLSYCGTDIGVWAVLMGFIFSIIRYQNLLPADRIDRSRKYRYRLKIEKVAL